MRKEEAFLVHDRDHVHCNTLLHQHVMQLQGMQRHPELQPPRSPDRQPLGCGILSTIKTELEPRAELKADWSARAKKFK